MLSHGQRPQVQFGHHVAVLESALKHLDPALAPTFDPYLKPGLGVLRDGNAHFQHQD